MNETRPERSREIPRHFEITGVAGYASVLVLVGIARFASAALPANPPAPYYLAIVLGSLWAGRGPGLVAAVLSALATAYYDLGTGGRFDLDSGDLVRLAIFFVLALITSSLVASRRETEERLRETIAELEELDRAKDEFIATVTHDLRSPLTSILGWAGLLRSRLSPDEKESRMALESIIRSARTQSRLVDDLLEMSRVQMRKISVQRERFDLRELLEHVLQSFELETDRQNVDLQRSLPELPVMFLGDPQRIEQMVRNLLANSFKFTPKGGTVTMTMECEPAAIRISVADTGAGIPAELRPHVFDRFAQASGARQKGGLGLGLAIVRHIAELHGGSVSVTSEGEGRGSTFVVELPRE